MVELRVEVGVGHVAAGGDVEVVDCHARGGARALAERHGHVAGMAVTAERALVDGGERQPRHHRDPVVGLLAVHRDVVEAELAHLVGGELVVLALDLL